MERLTKIGKLPRLSSSEIKSSRLGLGFEKLDRAVFDPERAYDKVAATGAKWARLQSGWARCEREEGVYDFAWLDKIVDNLASRGVEPWICLCYGNPIYTELAVPVFGAVGCPPISTERETNAWLAYVRATVEHFKDRVRYFEIWNEADNYYSWRHSEGEEATPERRLENAEEYGRFSIATSIAVKEIYPEAKVIGFALGHADELEWPNVDLEWVNRALATGLYKHIDYASFHTYSLDEELRRDRAVRFRRLLKSYNPKIELIQGEAGAQTRRDGRGAMKGRSWTPEKQTKALLRGLITDLAVGVELTSYFSTMDMIEALRGRISDKATYLDYGYFGILGCEFDEGGVASGEYYEKPSYYAYSALASLLHGEAAPCDIPYNLIRLPSRLVNGEDFVGKSLIVEGFRLDDGRRALIYWNAVDLLTATYEGTASFEIFGQKSGDINLVDLRDGSVYELPSEMTEDIGAGGVRLKNLPLTDCPLAIVFD